MLFSERRGYKTPRTEIQKESMDLALRTGIWNSLTVHIFEKMNMISPYGDAAAAYKSSHYLVKKMWFDFLKKPVDQRPNDLTSFVDNMRVWFSRAQWYEIYDLCEFIIITHQTKDAVQGFTEELNRVLQRELSGHRVIDSKITPITTEAEIAAIETAMDDPISEVGTHLSRALELLSDRKNPDYRNSMKESISAVETKCKKISGASGATLSDALAVLTRSGKLRIHPSLSQAFQKLYAYTNDAEGIRHSLMEEETLDQEDAIFMLVSCSGFVNYLTTKTIKASPPTTSSSA